MIRIRMPAIREIKGDSEMPAMIEVDNGIAIGQSPRWMVYCSHNRGIPRKRGQDIVNGYVSGTGACSPSVPSTPGGRLGRAALSAFISPARILISSCNFGREYPDQTFPGFIAAGSKMTTDQRIGMLARTQRSKARK
jgi:hypothetical protein